MLEEVWSRIRGADKWPETMATVSSIDRIPAQGRTPERASLTFFYSPGSGGTQSGEFTVDSISALYNVEEKDTFPIRFNPKHPEQYFSSEYTIPFIWKVYATLVTIFAALFLFIVLSSWLRT
jgi:hypothetical protein